MYFATYPLSADFHNNCNYFEGAQLLSCPMMSSVLVCWRFILLLYWILLKHSTHFTLILWTVCLRLTLVLDRISLDYWICWWKSEDFERQCWRKICSFGLKYSCLFSFSKFRTTIRFFHLPTLIIRSCSVF